MRALFIDGAFVCGLWVCLYDLIISLCPLSCLCRHDDLEIESYTIDVRTVMLEVRPFAKVDVGS